MDPSYYYGTYQDIASSPSIPVQYINSITMNYQYSSSNAQVQVEVDAVIQNANIWQKTVSIVPQESEPGDFNINFPVDINSLQTTIGDIQKSLGLSAAEISPYINIVATVSDGNSVFTHTLTLTMSQTFLVIGNNLVQTQEDSVGVFSYIVALATNPLFGSTISSPPLTGNTAPVILGPTDTIFTQLINSMDFTYIYGVTSDHTMQPLETVTVDAILENPGVWSQTFVLVPVTQENGNFTLNFPVDLTQYTNLVNNIQKETGVSTQSSYNLTIEANVQLTGQTSIGPVDQTFSDSIVTALGSGALTWTGKLQQSDKGTITTTTYVQTPAKIIGMQVNSFRVISMVILVIGLVLLAFLFFISAKKVDETDISKQIALETERKYKNLIITVNNLPELGLGETILTVDSLDELIKVAQALMKPINHFVNERTDIYWITDARTRYECLVVGESASVSDRNEGS